MFVRLLQLKNRVTSLLRFIALHALDNEKIQLQGNRYSHFYRDK